MRLPTILFLLVLAEGLVRLTWDYRMGEPGLVLGHPRRIEILAPDYTGYFNGQPLRINKLGFRDNREFTTEKTPNTFRIVALGDSVTFGDGVKFEDTWTYLLEKKLKAWNPKVDWQVWNLGVPGYDLSMQYRTLEEVSKSYQPDLIVQGFYENQLNGRNYANEGTGSLWKYKIRWFIRRHIYLYTQVKLWYGELLIAKGDPTGGGEKRNFDMMAKPTEKPTEYDLDHFELKHRLSNAPVPPKPKNIFKPEGELFNYCDRDVNLFKNLEISGQYPVVFFINIAPDIQPGTDQFVDGPHNEKNEFLKKYLVLNGRTPPSTYQAFWAYRPSEVPGAQGHGLAPANLVKADVLFEYLIRDVPKVSTLKTQNL